MNSVERPDKQSQSVDWEGELASLRNHALCSADGCGCKKKSYMQLDRLLRVKGLRKQQARQLVGASVSLNF